MKNEYFCSMGKISGIDSDQIEIGPQPFGNKNPVSRDDLKSIISGMLMKERQIKNKNSKNVENNMLIEYVYKQWKCGTCLRHFDRLKSGMFIGIKKGNQIYTGWSRCNLHFDDFDKETGIAHAFKNMVLERVPINGGFSKKYDKFKIRCQKYFQGAVLV